MTENDRYELTRSKWTGFYQELEGSIPTCWLNAVVYIITSAYNIHLSTEFNNLISSCPTIHQDLIDLQSENYGKSGENQERHLTAYYGEAADYNTKQGIVFYKRLRS